MTGIVFIIDDDAAVRDALLVLVESVGLEAIAFDSADAFLADPLPPIPACLVTDVCLPGTDGMALQQLLNERQTQIPLIAMSAHGDIPMAVEMVRLGAVDFIEKPFRNQTMLSRIREALATARQWHAEASQRVAVGNRLASLTPRETQVLELLLDGSSNKVIARRLALSHRTVETHRAHILHKMQADSVTSLMVMLRHHCPTPDTP